MKLRSVTLILTIAPSDAPRAGFEPLWSLSSDCWIKLCSADYHYTTVLILKILINVSCVGYGIIYFKYNPPTPRRYNDFLTALVEGQKE